MSGTAGTSGVVAAVIAVLVLAIASSAVRAQDAKPRVPVLVELFTSEGCSDCPAADRLLAELDKTQFEPAADAIVLSEHVTYWNHGGWKDPFSMDLADQRQDAYARQFALQSDYTPQAVVDGAWQLVGSDEAKLRATLAQAAATPKTAIALANAHWNGSAVEFSAQGTLDPKDHMYAAVAADATRSEVARGENAGRTLHHVAVVRAMKEFRAGDANGHALKLSDGGLVHSDGARLVVFVTDHKTNRVVAAAEIAVK